MTSSEIRQSFLDFFKSKKHTLVSSSSLMPDSPNLLFTNAGMNQFVPIFLGERKADVSRWAEAIPELDTRAADTQKCIRAGGKHNDLEDVGFDTYHHTFFEMLGNWSFGDYFKKEAIEWAWELLTQVWKFPAERLYATVYKPGRGDPAEFDQEAWDIWAKLFRSAGLDPEIHIVNGDKKDNFWMMGETGPCGPCSEVHMDLTPAGDTQGRLVNAGSARCIEIWNLVFIQFNANPDGAYSSLPARHVDTGMGFERVAAVMQNTAGFTRFDGATSNYETDVFRPLFDRLEVLSGKKYRSTLPRPDESGNVVPKTDQEQIDVAFRVIGDHIRTLSFAIADGIQPGNTDRNYVLRRILRRAVRYGRSLGFHEPFLHLLVETLVETMGSVFPELVSRQEEVKTVIRREEEAFNRTLDGGLRIFEDTLRIKRGMEGVVDSMARRFELVKAIADNPDLGLDENGVQALYEGAKLLLDFGQTIDRQLFQKILAASEESRLITTYAQRVVSEVDRLRATGEALPKLASVREDLARFCHAFATFRTQTEEMRGVLGGAPAFLLYDTYGFPLDLTELMARERGLRVDSAGFEKLMEGQRARARAARKREVIEVSQIDSAKATEFVGFDRLEATARVLEVVRVKDRHAVVLDASPFYAEMGGQVGDTGRIKLEDRAWEVVDTQKAGNAWLHFLANDPDGLETGAELQLSVDLPRRNAIQRHHTVTHLLHWALHEVVSPEVSQKGSFVGNDKLTFDFNCAPLTPEQVEGVERLVNERILDNASVSWAEVKYAHVKDRVDIMQFFGDKYGEWVRVVQIGGTPTALDGYSMELCGGTHTQATGEIGLFRIVNESAIAAGVRRIEAVAGLEAYGRAKTEVGLIQELASKLNSPIADLETKVGHLLEQQKTLEKQLRSMQQQQAAAAAKGLLDKARTLNEVPAIIERIDADGNALQGIANDLKGKFDGIIVLVGAANGNVSLVASVGSAYAKKHPAGRIIQQIAPVVGGKGGGRPDNARGGGKETEKVDQALAKAKELISS